jgi:hypothetical protein
MEKNKIIFITFFAFTALLLTYFLNKKNSSKCNPKILKQTATLTDIKIEKFRLQKFFSKKDTILIIKADEGELCREYETANCKNVKAKFINKNQNIAMLKSNNAFFDLKNNTVKLSGDIKSKILNNPANNNNVN